MEHLSRGHRVNNARWEPRVGQDAAECLWRSVLYRVGVTAGMIVFVVIVFSAGQHWYLAYVEAVVPTGCMVWSLVEYHRFTYGQGRPWAFLSAGALAFRVPTRTIWPGVRSTRQRRTRLRCPPTRAHQP